MDYLELNCTVFPREPFADIVIAALADIGFDMFEEHETGLKAYRPAKGFNENDLRGIAYFNPNEFCSVSWTTTTISGQNWNKEWERNFNPVIIDNRILVRAIFHPSQPGYDFEIVIQPKMSFGTGHHQTTALMMKEMLNMDFKNKSVLDMGCGSGILAILAGMLEAIEIQAVDYDENATENALENCKYNAFPDIEVLTGSEELIREKKFDIVVANINRNVILNQLATYATCLNSKGELLLSGFYKEDMTLIRSEALLHHLEESAHNSMDEWVVMHFNKR